ncbi:hypothetical protein BS636_12830 [Acinetobacter sp. LoGeW2-3]|uniref:hypothetical protein n=1 Tax=Acinetobacter sp. LoGeW2-3 TaxID=1808001 RepID=UPI000C05B668|nr:hypothetical protein [Acinetobacter sp. LoGeW2-3]ATO20491.1 hypothetical protein BS636_12830 [Acinetobacter sp. LoGeW2-3]
MKVRIISTLALLGSIFIFTTASIAGEGGLHFAEKNIAKAAEYREKKKVTVADSEVLQAKAVEAKIQN